MTETFYDVIIVGAGVYGLCIAYHLTKNPNIKTLLIQQYQVGHHNGSSHSPTRITRSTYDKQLYRDLNSMALNQHWKQLQTLLDCKLVYSAPFIYFDNQQHSYQEYKKITKGHQNFQIITPEEISIKYSPMPLIKTKQDVIVDKKAGILAADELIMKLKDYLVTQCKQNFLLLENTQVENIQQTNQCVQIRTSKGEILRSKKAILSSGRWISQLVPQIKNHFKVVKQYVAYLQLKDIKKYDVLNFNSFYYRYTQDIHFYCLSDHNQWGVKFAKHAFDLKPEEDNLEYQTYYLKKMAKQIFGEQFTKIKKIQNCYYTHTPTEDFILDYIDPESEKILVCSCCSGHGFKFAPIIGDITAKIIQQKESNTSEISNDIYNKWQYMFKFAYHKGINLN